MGLLAAFFQFFMRKHLQSLNLRYGKITALVIAIFSVALSKRRRSYREIRLLQIRLTDKNQRTSSLGPTSSVPNRAYNLTFGSLIISKNTLIEL